MTELDTRYSRYNSGRRFLRYDYFCDSVRSALFGIMAQRAMKVIRSYESDLYHDAHWLRDNVHGECVFYYGVREMGTSIGMERELVEQYNLKVWEVRVECVNPRNDSEYGVLMHGTWEAVFVELKEDVL